jgi:hypothetical protein
MEHDGWMVADAIKEGANIIKKYSTTAWAIEFSDSLDCTVGTGIGRANEEDQSAYRS